MTMPDLSNVIAHPALRRTHRTVTLLQIDGRHFATAGFNGGCAGDSWAWIVSTVAEELSVDPECVGCLDVEDGDFVTVEGLPVYRIGF